MTKTSKTATAKSSKKSAITEQDFAGNIHAELNDEGNLVITIDPTETAGTTAKGNAKIAGTNFWEKLEITGLEGCVLSLTLIRKDEKPESKKTTGKKTEEAPKTGKKPAPATADDEDDEDDAAPAPTTTTRRPRTTRAK